MSISRVDNIEITPLKGSRRRCQRNRRKGTFSMMVPTPLCGMQERKERDKCEKPCLEHDALRKDDENALARERIACQPL